MKRVAILAAGAAVVAVVVAAAVLFESVTRRPTQAESVPTRAPIEVRQPGGFRGPPMESSGIALSRRRPGLFWTMNDSGNPPSLFLIDTLARDHGFVSLEPVPNIDWEALSAGPCGAEWCLYVGDIGDNRAVRPTVVVYRLAEPTDAELAAYRAGPVDSIVVRYPDGPRDAEAMVARDDGSLVIISKGQEGDATAYRVGPDGWRAGRAEAEPIWRLPLATSIFGLRLVTDAALSPDRKTLAVRTYREIHLFGSGAGPIPDRPLVTCPIGGLEPIGEGIGWLTDETLVLTSEIGRGGVGPITLLRCPAP